jgi:hypothetical protein
LYSASVFRFLRLVSATTQFCIRSVALSLCIMYYVCAFVLARFDHRGTSVSDSCGSTLRLYQLCQHILRVVLLRSFLIHIYFIWHRPHTYGCSRCTSPHSVCNSVRP